jgi:hypothetical protein
MNKFQEVYDLQSKYNNQIVARYDLLSGLSPELYRIDGFLYHASSANGLRIVLKPIDSVYDTDADTIVVNASEVLTYFEVRGIYSSTKALFENSKEIFKGVFKQSLYPIKRDLEVLEYLLEEFSKQDLIIEKDEVVCLTE